MYLRTTGVHKHTITSMTLTKGCNAAERNRFWCPGRYLLSKSSSWSQNLLVHILLPPVNLIARRTGVLLIGETSTPTSISQHDYHCSLFGPVLQAMDCKTDDLAALGTVNQLGEIAR